MGPAPSGLKNKKKNKKIPDTLTVFWNFVSEGNAQGVLKMVTDDPTLHEEKNQNGENAVHVAIAAGYKDVVRILIETNPSTLQQKKSGKHQIYPLQQAIEYQKKEIVSLLIRLKADVNCRPSNVHGPPPLQLAVQQWKLNRDWAEPLIRELRWAGADMVDGGGENIAIFAVKVGVGDLECVKCLFDCGAKIYPDSTTQGPLEYAVNQQNKEFLNLLLHLRVDINYPNSQGQTPLHLSHTRYFHKRLISAGANVNATDTLGNTPLHATIAHRLSHVPSIRLLLDSAANVNVRNSELLTPLHMVIQGNRWDMAQVLVKAGADIHAPTSNNWTPLLLAVKQKNSTGHSLIKLLLEMGADPSTVLPDGRTCLHLACHNGNFPVVQVLLSFGCDPNIGDQLGNTPVHVSIQRNRLRIWKILLKNGGDETLRNQGGETPEMLSKNRSWRIGPVNVVSSGSETESGSGSGSGSDSDDSETDDDSDDGSDDGEESIDSYSSSSGGS